MSEPKHFTDEFIESRFKDYSFVLFKKQALDMYWLKEFLKENDNRFGATDDEKNLTHQNEQTSKICVIL